MTNITWVEPERTPKELADARFRGVIFLACYLAVIAYVAVRVTLAVYG